MLEALSELRSGLEGVGLSGVIDKEPGAPLQEAGASLRVPDFANGVDPGAQVPWPEPGYQSDMLVLVSDFDPGPGRPCPGFGDMMKLPDFLSAFTGPEKPSPGLATCYISTAELC